MCKILETIWWGSRLLKELDSSNTRSEHPSEVNESHKPTTVPKCYLGRLPCVCVTTSKLMRPTMDKSKQKSRKRQLTSGRSMGGVFPKYTPSSARLISVVEKANSKVEANQLRQFSSPPRARTLFLDGVTSLQESEYGGVGINTVGTFFFCA
jgi:hypothetical protein